VSGHPDPAALISHEVSDLLETHNERQVAAILYRRDMNLRQVGEALGGYSPTTIAAWLRREGVAVQPRASEARTRYSREALYERGGRSPRSGRSWSTTERRSGIG
jgi:hypothetical protein